MNLEAAISPTPITVAPQTMVLAAIAAMQPVARSSRSGDARPAWESSANCVIVVESGQVVGILTASDVVRLAVNHQPLETIAIAEVMSQPAVTMTQSPNATVAEALALLRRYGIRHLPVVNHEGGLVGLVTQDSVFALLESALAEEDPTAAAGSGAIAVPTPFAWKTALQASQHYLTDILNNTKACICSFRLYPDGNYEYDYYSQGSTLVYGYAPQHFKAQANLWRSRVLPDDLETVIMPAVQAVFDGETHLDLEFRFRHGDGALRWIRESYTARWDQAQRCWMVTTVAVDISARKRAEMALQASEARFRAVFEQAAVGINQADATGRFIQTNQYFCDLLGYTQAELLALRYQDITHPDDLAQFYPFQTRQLQGELTCFTLERRYRHKAGEWIWTELTLSLIRDEAGRVVSDLAIVVDIRDRKRAELALRYSEAKSRAVLAVMPDLMFRLGADGRYREVINPRPDLELFFEGRDPVGRRLVEFAPADMATRKLSIMELALTAGKIQLYEQEIETPDGWRYEEVRVVKSGDDEVLFMIRDITDRKQAQAQIVHNSLHDPLTGLPNRTLLSDRLNAAIHRAQRNPNYQYAVLFLDLDRFKVINDSLGHAIGDQLLIAIAQKLHLHIRTTDVAARLGGDEFVLLLEEIDGPDKAVTVAERVLADCQTPLMIEGNEVLTGVSIGIATGSERYTDAAEIIRDADIAMYRAKHRQRGTYQFFDPAMHTQVLAQHTLEVELYRAIEQNELAVYYQPMVDLVQGRLMGFEALVRWLHPTRGWLTPDGFLPCAEATGLIVALDQWMLRQTCRQMSLWQRQFPALDNLCMGVNLSAQNFATTSLLADIEAVLAETGLPGHCLNLEITENILIQDMDKAIYLLTQLADRGIRISVDDFGVGHSSLQYLHRFPLTHLKIDRGFVRHLGSDHRDYAMVQMILGLSQQLGLSAIAEGIETSQQLRLIQQLGCQFAQGYLFSEPITAAAAEVYLSEQALNWPTE
ncbi:EAL domain-containing protein [Nodosilinea sp. E11]|uniref:EAL domain-containing protein n=1 Tax=Nodosilinea sp. E11 TaxID=3037479 RepID=UPI0029351343|nr:EAL domain-containing protein [Nodosilinea sp. E11]WOD41203.1 EAL domain-containing protein [Nodosilinea sp. E11]